MGRSEPSEEIQTCRHSLLVNQRQSIISILDGISATHRVNLFVANEEFQLVARVADRSNFGVAKEREPRVAEQADWFATTHWSVVRTAGDPAPTVVQEALAVQTKNAPNYDR